jgi:PTS system cellobiose-specific IIA component
MDYEEIVCQIIVNGGNARSLAMEAVAEAKKGDFEGARDSLSKVEDELANAHKIQTELIQNEAAGVKSEVSLLMVHAQDHLMNAITVKDMSKEIVDIYERMYRENREIDKQNAKGY